jgi:hypothetical protein
VTSLLDEKEIEYGAMLWGKTYAVGMDDTGALERLRKNDEAVVKRFGEEPAGLGPTTRLLAIAKWIDCGAPRIVTDEKYAAALMCSRVGADIAEDLIAPWKAFRVDLPRGLLGFDDYIYTSVMVATFEGLKAAGDRCGAALLLSGERPAREGEGHEPDGISACSTRLADSFQTLLFGEVGEVDEIILEGLSKSGDARKQKALVLAQRLVVGLLYTMQYTTNFKPAKTSLNDPRRKLRDGPPKHRTIFVGAPIKVDARSMVQRYCGQTKKGSPPSVQTLVRGHFRRQAVGVGRQGRKVIWIEPYWKGPEEAPILVHPHRVG